MVLPWPEAPAHGRQKQEDYKFKGGLGYTVNWSQPRQFSEILSQK